MIRVRRKQEFYFSYVKRKTLPYTQWRDPVSSQSLIIMEARKLRNVSTSRWRQHYVIAFTPLWLIWRSWVSLASLWMCVSTRCTWGPLSTGGYCWPPDLLALRGRERGGGSKGKRESRYAHTCAPHPHPGKPLSFSSLQLFLSSSVRGRCKGFSELPYLKWF